MSVLRRYELERQGDQRFGNLSGGQQARFQILLLELQGSTALLLDEPTDNLDLESAEALQEGLESYEGTVLAVTHDFAGSARTFDRFLVFVFRRPRSPGGRPYPEPAGNETRVRRAPAARPSPRCVIDRPGLPRDTSPEGDAGHGPMYDQRRVPAAPRARPVMPHGFLVQLCFKPWGERRDGAVHGTDELLAGSPGT